MLVIAYLSHTLFFILIATLFLAKNRTASIFHPFSIYLLFHFIVFIARSYFVLFDNFDHAWWYMRWSPNEEELIFALWISDFALFCFWIGCTLAKGEKLVYPRSGIDMEISSNTQKAYWITILLFGPLALYSAITSSGGFDSDAVRMELVDGIRVHTETTGYLADAKNFLFGLTILTVVRYRFAWYSLIPLVAFYFYRLSIGYSRWVLVYSIIALTLIFFVRAKRKWPSHRNLATSAILAFPSFYIFDFLGKNRDFFRDLISSNQKSNHDVFESQGFNSLDTLDFANFDYLTYITANVPSRSGTFTYGTQYLQLFTEPIPRIIWTSKPIGAPIKLLDLNDFGNFLGLTTSLPGDAWLSAGYIGIVVALTSLGFLLTRMYRSACRQIRAGHLPLLYLVGAPLLFQFFRDGGISIFKFLLFALIPIVLFNHMNRGKAST